MADLMGYRKNADAEIYEAISELRAWSDWYVSCTCGHIPPEASAAYKVIKAFEKIDASLSEERSAYSMAHGVFTAEDQRNRRTIAELEKEKHAALTMIAMVEKRLADAERIIARAYMEGK